MSEDLGPVQNLLSASLAAADKALRFHGFEGILPGASVLILREHFEDGGLPLELGLGVQGGHCDLLLRQLMVSVDVVIQEELSCSPSVQNNDSTVHR
jgi:hypothetical protein